MEILLSTLKMGDDETKSHYTTPRQKVATPLLEGKLFLDRLR